MERLGKRRAFIREWLRIGLRATVLMALLAVTWFAVRAAWNMYGRFSASSVAAQNTEAELSRLEAQYTKVSASVGEFSSPRGIEAKIRERYGLGRPGEGELNIVRPAGSAVATSTTQSSNFFSRIFNTLRVW